MPRKAPHHSPTKGLPRKTQRDSNRAVRKRQAKRTYPTYSRTWRAIRAAHMAEEPLCRACRKVGRLKPGNQVDHIDGDPKNNHPDNLQTLCASHHSQKTARENGGFGNGRRP